MDVNIQVLDVSGLSGRFVGLHGKKRLLRSSCAGGLSWGSLVGVPPSRARLQDCVGNTR